MAYFWIVSTCRHNTLMLLFYDGMYVFWDVWTLLFLPTTVFTPTLLVENVPEGI